MTFLLISPFDGEIVDRADSVYDLDYNKVAHCGGFDIATQQGGEGPIDTIVSVNLGIYTDHIGYTIEMIWNIFRAYDGSLSPPRLTLNLPTD